MLQTNSINSRSKKVTPLQIKKVRYVAVHKILPHPTPLAVYTKQAYFEPNSGEIRQRQVATKLNKPISHQIHLTKGTLSESFEDIGDNGTNVIILVKLYGSVQTLLNGRRSGTSAYIHEENDVTSVYFIANWKDVLEGAPPDTPLSHIEDGHRVYYLQKATDKETELILGAVSQTNHNL